MVSEKDLQSYLKVAASALPCREARKEFSSYVHNVAHDISIENPDADFATVASLLGTTPKQVAADFVESQSPQTISRWNRSAHRYKYGLQLLVGIIVVVLFSVVIFFTTTKGVMIVNTETTYTDLGGEDYSQNELDKMAKQKLEQIAKECQYDKNTSRSQNSLYKLRSLIIHYRIILFFICNNIVNLLFRIINSMNVQNIVRFSLF